MRQVIVTGSRSWADRRAIWEALDRCDVELLIHGDCETGADRIADAWAEANGVPCARMPAWWKAYGREAGPWRNNCMLRFFPEAIVLAFPLPGSKGTIDCINQARECGRQVFVHAQ
jgi:hypothetical protein